VTRVALVLALAAWDEIGPRPGDRVEHGGVVPPELAERLAALGLVVVTQPAFVRDRGDRYLREVDPDDVAHLYPCGRLLAAGVGVGGSTDAPFGDPDPWRAIATAIDRRTAAGHVLGPYDRVPPRRALDLFLGALDDPAGPPRRPAAGAPADLCLLAVSVAEALAAPSADHVRATIASGRLLTLR
jgi:predicted amidohydrolase YtcJ